MPGSDSITRFFEVWSAERWGVEDLTLSTVTDRQLDELECSIGHSFPPLYREFLKTYHFRSLNTPVLRFYLHPPLTWQVKLNEMYRKAWLPERILGMGLIPFGDEAMAEAGPVCFDATRKAENGDYPVVFWDHDWASTKKEIRPLFSSSEAMFRCLTFYAEQDVDFIRCDEDDSSAQFGQKRRLLAQFLALDPSGAGREARGYWTCWGVSP